MGLEWGALPSNVFKSKRHDTAVSPSMTFTPPPGLEFTLLDPPGASAKFIMRLPKETAPKVNKPAVITGPWSVRFDPIAADVDTIGAYDCEVEVTFANGKKITLPTEGFLSWVIAADLDNA